MEKKQGFTLIELLVVVLIIGILSAVALPQYTKAVEKSRLSELMTIQNSLEQATEIYLLANGFPSAQVDLVDSLDINFPDFSPVEEVGFGARCNAKNVCFGVSGANGVISIAVMRFPTGNFTGEPNYRLVSMKSGNEMKWERFAVNGLMDISKFGLGSFGYI